MESWDDMSLPMGYDNEVFDVMPYDDMSEEFNNDPFMSYLNLIQKRNQQTGISHLCCKNACSMLTLISFCPSV